MWFVLSILSGIGSYASHYYSWPIWSTCVLGAISFISFLVTLARIGVLGSVLEQAVDDWDIFPDADGDGIPDFLDFDD